MQLTISSDEPLENVLSVVGALYGVQLTVAEPPVEDPGAGDEAGQRVTKTRH